MRLNNGRLIGCMSLLLLLSPSLHAAKKSKPFVIAIQAGPLWEHAGQTQTLTLSPRILESYIPNNETHVLGAIEFFFGIRQPLSPKFQAQWGLTVATVSNAKLGGLIWDHDLMQVADFSYNYEINHTHVALKSKFIYENDYYVNPWISASVGLAMNKAQLFSEQELVSGLIQPPNFSYNIRNALTYTLGIGMQKSINSVITLGIGYEFSDLGISQLGTGVGDTISGSLILEHFYTNGLVFNATLFT